MNAYFVRCSILALAAASALPAQTIGPLKVSVPFSFNVQGRDMPAGEYVAERLNNTPHVTLKCRERSVNVFVPTMALESPFPQQTGKLVFHRYGDQYFLSEVWSAGRYGRQLLRTKQERDLARQAQPERTSVAAKR